MLVKTPAASRGFTLVELMTVVTLTAIMAMIALPAFTSMIAGMRIKTMAGEMQSSLMHARSEARKRNLSVTVAPVNGGWQNGWSVTDSTNAVLETRNALLVGGKNLTVSNNTAIVYRANGRSTSPDATMVLTSGDTTTTRCVKISLSGLPIVRSTCS